MTLNYKVFHHSPVEGMSGTSTLIYGERDAVLIDACARLEDAHRLAAELIGMQKNITHIYISHFHPDHYLSVGVLLDAFPGAKVVALPSVVEDILASAEDKLKLARQFLGEKVPATVTFPQPMPESRLEVEGQVIEFSDDWDGDSPNNTMVWIPSIRVACGTDVVFNEVHVWTIESDAPRRNKWRASLKKLREMNPRVVVPGHCSPSKLNCADTSGIDFTLKYLDDYEEVLAKATTGDELVQGMEKRYPGINASLHAIHWQARILFPTKCSDRIMLPPGAFRTPSGEIASGTARD